MLGPNQQKWINALKSGEYEQCDGSLEDSNGYCCLGVACKVAEENNIEIYYDDNGEIIGGTLEDQEEVWE